MRIANVVSATIVALVTMLFVGAGTGTIPPLGRVLDPGGGVWAAASDAVGIDDRVLRVPGMRQDVTVTFDAAGVPDVRAASDWDLHVTQGYLHATFRLAQLDLSRRTAVGRLAELVGPAALESDTFELQAGLLRTATANWAAMSPASSEGEALLAYSRGVNARLAELRRSRGWPALFVLTGVYPRDWTPVDSLAVQLLMTQNLNYSTAPLDYTLLRQSLGAARAASWFPLQPANPQRPYDVGPYRDLGVSPLPPNANAAAPGAAAEPGDPAATAPRAGPGPGPATTHPTAAGSARAAHDIVGRIGRLPHRQVHFYPASNAWAVNGPKVAGGSALLAADPHLQLTLPSFWYQAAMSAPGTRVSGATLVGLPGVLVGRNDRISWSMTNVQNQSTLFYAETTSTQRPGQYFWRGAWRDMERVHYTIPVRGAPAVPLTVELTVHGPVMTQVGQTTAVTWMGNYPSQSIRAILAVNKAADFAGFREALRSWHAPTLNFVYADGAGNIGAVAAGAFPVVAAGEPWLPLPGTGAYDVVGAIPYDAAPQVYNPPDHVVVSANQRPVAANYPYYVGTSANAYDEGYRARRIHEYLSSRPRLTADDFVDLQNDVTDHLATVIVPKLTAALRDADLDGIERAALHEVASWDRRMTMSAPGASIWWTFWTEYLAVVFQPWWDATIVPVSRDRPRLEVSPARTSLNQLLETWTLHDPSNVAFTPPGQRSGSAATAMRVAFQRTVASLRRTLGEDPAAWRWERLHTRTVESLAGVPALGYGPFPAEGDPWTVNSAEGGLDSSFGPSWRMVVAWTGPTTASARAVYPGGQSEDPASPWYQSFVADWRSGRLRNLPMPADRPDPAAVTWTLRAERR